MIFAAVVGILAAIAATVLLYLKVIPAKFDGTFKKKIPQKLHDYFNFKSLYLIESYKAILNALSVATNFLILLTLLALDKLIQ